jgi:hypothetical protein
MKFIRSFSYPLNPFRSSFSVSSAQTYSITASSLPTKSSLSFHDKRRLTDNHKLTALLFKVYLNRAWYKPLKRTMHTSSTPIDELRKLTSGLSVHEVATRFAGCYPETNPLDLYRAYIATILHNITGVDAQTIYNAIQYTTALEKGDFMFATPALRLKDKKASDYVALAAQWAGSVRTPGLCFRMLRSQRIGADIAASFPKMTRLSTGPNRTTTSSLSTCEQYPSDAPLYRRSERLAYASARTRFTAFEIQKIQAKVESAS